MLHYDALLLTGGRGRRLGGPHKPSLPVGGAAMVERAAAALAGAGRLVVVGPAHGLRSATVVTSEEPPGSGPVAAIAAGVAHVTAPLVAVVAADLPFLTAASIAELAAALQGGPGAAAAFPEDGAGRDQHLCAMWRTEALRAALAALGDPEGAAVRRLVAAAPGPVVRLAPTGDAAPSPWFDCDTPADLARANRWASGPP